MGNQSMKRYGCAPRTKAKSGRRLRFEFLEQRDLLAVMRIVNWNAANHPNNATEFGDFQTILQAIGNETVQGNTKRLDILALQETDPVIGGDSIGQVESILDALYPSTNYASFASGVDGGGDSTGFVYDTSSLSLLETVEVAPASLIHSVLRGKFRPVATLGESDFYVYTIHLKSGDTGSDVSIRASEAIALRADADSLGEGASVLFVGDFNMKTSAEGAYSTFLASGAGQLQDVANAPGDWFSNAAFKSLHSQDPRMNMDDRFDIQFASGEFYDGVGVDYVTGSYHVFGNNGTHTFGGAISTGSGASVDVLAALAAASDHLPVIADYEVLVSTPNVRIVETGGETKTIEGGLYDTYGVVLDTIPAANVTVTVTPDAQVDVGNGAGVPLALVFTPANALTPQSVIVHAADDLIGEGNHLGLITHSSASADAAYNGLSVASVNVKIVDNDTPTIVINEIDSDQTGTDSFEFIELYDGGVGNVSLTGKSVVFFNGSNDLSYAVFDLDGLFTDANGFFVLGNAAIANIDLVFSNNLLQNGADAVALFAADATAFPTGTGITTTGLLDAVVYDTNDADDAELLALLESGQPQINENEHAMSEFESLARVPDDGNPRQTATYVAQSPTPGELNQSQTPGVIITQSGTRVDVEEGGATDTYQIALATIPTSSVTITVDPDGQTDLGAGAGVAIVLTFTTGNALIPQTVTVTAVDDAAAEGDHSSIIAHTAASADAGYNGIAIGNVVANVVDNDVGAPPSIVISEIMYNPASDETAPGVAEWIEIVNAGATAVDVSGWMFDDEDATSWSAFPSGTMLNPNQVAVFFDAAFTTEAVFRAEWSVPASALVIGINWAGLANDPSAINEVLALLNGSALQMDLANFDDAAPWPSAQNGPSIYLKNISLDNNNGTNWARSVVGMANAVSPSGPQFSTSDVGSPGRVPAANLPGDYNMNGVVDAADYTVWRDTLGSTSDPRADGSGASVGVPDGVVDQLDYNFWTANFGQTLGSGSEGGVGGGAAMPVRAAESSATPSVDIAFVELDDLSSVAMSASASRSMVRAQSTAMMFPAADLRLLLHRPPMSMQLDEGIVALISQSSHDDYSDVDHFFASLDDRELAASVASL